MRIRQGMFTGTELFGIPSSPATRVGWHGGEIAGEFSTQLSMIYRKYYLNGVFSAVFKPHSLQTATNAELIEFGRLCDWIVYFSLRLQ